MTSDHSIDDPFAAARARLAARLDRPRPSRADLPTLDELVEEIGNLQPMPAVATRILNLGDDHRFSAHDLATIIAGDQALTARILRLANSAYYGAPRTIGTVRDAVVLLGFRAVRQVAIACCLVATRRPLTNLDDEMFWQHAIATGLLAELIAKVEGQHEDAAFTAGVLHNIGRLALDQRRPHLLAEVAAHAATHQQTIHHAQRELLGYTDADLGGALALHWNFPAPLVGAIRDHAALVEAPPAAGSAAAGSLAAIVARARIFARSHGLSDALSAAPIASTGADADDDDDPFSLTLYHEGGMPRILERADAFIAAALA